MRWVLACIGLIVVIVVFSLAALDQKNVVWTGATPQCPHCRHDVRLYSNVCGTCGRAFDWETYETECEACLSELDSDYLKSRFLGHEKEFEALLRESILPEEAIPDLVLYARTLESGSCGFCGGTGRWLAPGVWEGTPENGGDSPRIEILKERLEGACPVCFGSGSCVLCGGDHRTEHAREAAERAIRELVDLERRVDPLRDPESADAALRALERFVSRHSGRIEMRRAPAFYAEETPHMTWAQIRRRFVEGVLGRLP